MGCEGRWRSEQWRDRTNNTSYCNNSINMGRIILCSTILLCLIVPVPAPLAKDDPRSIFNFLIEPRWCLVPKIVRELLHIKYFGAPLNEVGPCTRSQRPRQENLNLKENLNQKVNLKLKLNLNLKENLRLKVNLNPWEAHTQNLNQE